MSQQSVSEQRAIRELKAYWHRLTRQQIKTLKGQILAGNAEAAMKGLDTILGRQRA